MDDRVLEVIQANIDDEFSIIDLEFCDFCLIYKQKHLTQQIGHIPVCTINLIGINFEDCAHMEMLLKRIDVAKQTYENAVNLYREKGFGVCIPLKS